MTTLSIDFILKSKTTLQHTQHKIRHKDGETNRLNLWIPDEHAYMVFLILPAMGIRASFYSGFAEKLSKEGVAVATIDWRGHGTSSIRAGKSADWGIKQLVQDVNDVCQWLSTKVNFLHIYLIGHSFGGQIALLYAPRYPDNIRGLITIASSDPYYKLWPRPHQWGLHLAGHLVFPISKVVGHFPGYAFGFAQRESMGVIRDWGFAVRHGYFSPKGDPFDYVQAKRNYEGNLLVISIAHDLLAVESAMDYTMMKFEHLTRKIHVHLDPTSKDQTPLNHFNWVRHSELILSNLMDQMFRE